MAGLTAAIEAAEVGHDVILVERNPYLGGRVAQMHKYFPKLCPPGCGLEINYQRLQNNPRVQIFTQTTVHKISGAEGSFQVEVLREPRFVNDQCTACGACAEACQMEVDNPFNYGLDKMKATYLPYPRAYPPIYALHPDLAASSEAAKVQAACKYGAIDLSEKPRTETWEVGSIVWATGWDPFDPTVVSYYGYGKNRNVITNVVMERLAADDGPTRGRILRPSDGKPPAHVLFVQCAGSRDQHNLAYCSGVCCLASLKQATYVREQYPTAKVTICFIDIRTPDRLEDFYVKVKADPGVAFVKSKVADITEDAATGTLTVRGEDTLAGKKFETTADLVVLATGLVPCKPTSALAVDDYGFVLPEQAAGIHPAGCATRPVEVSTTVQDGTAAALRAIQAVVAR
jgi:quinone-modifying oxidoreductase subunit QmoA